MDELSILAYELRIDVLDMVFRAKTGHIGGDFSVMEILTDLYFRQMDVGPGNWHQEGRDRFVLSKGHSMESYYAVLARKGFLNIREVKEKFSAFQSPYIGHPNNKLPGIEMNSGSLGHGLPVCVGMALAGKMDKKPYRVYTVMGDGELAEGSVWEGVMSASQYKLDNLCAVVDLNGLQISGTTDQVMNHRHLRERFESFGWNVEEADGNHIPSLDEAFGRAKQVKGMPTAVIAHTTKGKGVSFMENQPGWHHKVPTKEEYALAKEELEGHIRQLKEEAGERLPAGKEGEG